MAFNGYLGEMLLLPKSKDGIEHLWVVTLHPDNSGQTVIVNLTTKRPNSDATVVLDKSSHPFIHHPTVVNYTDARIVDINKLVNAVESGHFYTHSVFEKDELRKIQAGLLESLFTPIEVKKFCQGKFDF